jgi:hypothetical protein
MVVPGTGNKRMAIWQVRGDGSTNAVNVGDIKMSKIEAAWTVNVNAEYHKKICTITYDYIAGPVSIIEIGDGLTQDDAIQNGKDHLLIVIGY